MSAPSQDPHSITIDAARLTPSQLYRELTALRELIETRLDAIDTATEIFHDNLVRVPTDVDKQIAHLKELHDEKFKNIEMQFRERDVRLLEEANSTRRAVDAALAAAKEAVTAQNTSNVASIAKSEMAFGKELDGIKALIGSNNKSQDEKIGDMKSRLDRGEGQTAGGQKSVATMIAIAAVLAALCGGAVAAIATSLIHTAATPTVITQPR
jgi:hypothetical protein